MDVNPDGPMQGAPSNWLQNTLRWLNFVAAMRERNQIRQVCRETLDLYRQVESEMPHASNTERYARVIEKRSGADPRVVQRVMRRAEESFAAWPVERPLNFRDIVQYVVVTDSLKIDLAVDGVRSRLVDLALAIVTEVIPADL